MRAKDLDTKYFSEVTPDEIKRWHQQFRKDCPSGKLKRTQFNKIYTNYFPEGNSEEFAAFAFNLFDVNGNGTIEFSEFLMALSVTSRGDIEEKLDCTCI